MIRICKLCLEEKELIGRSHLFPNFMYKGIGDGKNRMYVISSSEPSRKKTVQNGAYEEYILCADCDTRILSKIERYAKNYFYSQVYSEDNENFVKGVSQQGIESIHCNNIDYNQFKLFLQSLIWRASITNHQLFNNFRLTGQQEEELRNSIYNSAPLQEDDFPCLMCTSQDDVNTPTDLVFINPSHPQTVSFIINQFVYVYYLAKTIDGDSVRQLILSKKNEMGIIKLPACKWTELRASILHSVAHKSPSKTLNY